MSSNSERSRTKLLASSAVADLPAGQRGQWLVSFAELYRQAVAATRAKRVAPARQPFRLLPASWRVKLAIVCHALMVHRYKPRDEALLLQGAGSLFVRVIEDPHFLAPAGDAEGGDANLPAWMIDDFEVLARNEPTLWPDRGFLSRFSWYKPYLNGSPGRLYFHLYSLLSSAKVDTVVICPWLKRGGADKGILQFVEYYASRGGVTLITTLDEDSPWLERTPQDVRAIEFGKLARDLSEEERIAVLTRLLLELAPRIIHNVQSDLGWRCLARHGIALRSNGAKLVASVFTDETGPSGRSFGYAIEYLPKVRDFIDLVLTDNRPLCETVRRRYHLSPLRARRAPFWHSPELLQKGASPGPLVKSASVLWAGRLCYQKRPDLLFSIAQACTGIEFHVYGEADGTEFAEKWRRELASLSNVWMYGAYDTFDSILERRPYQAFCYATAFDGLPNVLLEAASHQIPIVAPLAIGGLSDLITAETAFPVDDPSEPDGYVRALRDCLADSAEAKRRARNAHDLVETGHSRQAFNAAMDEALASSDGPTRN